MILIAAALLSFPGPLVPAGAEKDAFTHGTASNGLTYHLRVPPGHDPKKGSPAVIILHGSNMNSRTYAETMAARWPGLARDFIIIGIDGEKRVPGSPDSNPAFNYTYVNFVGKSTYRGFPGSDRESPALIAEAVEELRKRLSLERVFIGGHSQGGYCAYSAFMNYPDLFAGAFPVSAGLIFQCEPTAYAEASVREQQRKGALAIVHGKNDGVVEFAQGQYAHEAFEEDAFPMLRFLTHPGAGHMFAQLPVEEAVRWLEASTSPDPARLLRFAEESLAAGRQREATTALRRAELLDGKKKHSSRIRALKMRVDALARPGARSLEKAMASKPDGSWIDEFLEFRSRFEFAEASRGVMDAFRKLRGEHENPAEELWNLARKDFQAGSQEAGHAKCEEVVRKHFASSRFRLARRLLAERKGSAAKEKRS